MNAGARERYPCEGSHGLRRFLFAPTASRYFAGTANEIILNIRGQSVERRSP